MKQIILVRHGENDFGKKRLAGRLPGVFLNKEGLAQAERVAVWLERCDISAVYSSPMDRAVQTAQPLCRTRSLPLQIVQELTEIDYGVFQGKSYRQLQRTNLWKKVATHPLAVRFPGGEDFHQARSRAIEAIGVITSKLPEGGAAACFSHSDIIRLLLTHFLGMPLESFQRLEITQGSLSIVMLGEHSVRVPHINLVALPLKPPSPILGEAARVINPSQSN